MESLQVVKKQLKKWESDFVKENLRRPNKDDIDERQEIKDLYKRYSQLKKEELVGEQAKSNESQNHADDTSVWGRELNKTSVDQTKTEPADDKTENKPAGSFMQSLGKKLLSNINLDQNQVKSRLSFKRSPQRRKSAIVKEPPRKPFAANLVSNGLPVEKTAQSPLKDKDSVTVNNCDHAVKDTSESRAKLTDLSPNTPGMTQKESIMKDVPNPLTLKKIGVGSHFMRNASKKPFTGNPDCGEDSPSSPFTETPSEDCVKTSNNLPISSLLREDTATEELTQTKSDVKRSPDTKQRKRLRLEDSPGNENSKPKKRSRVHVNSVCNKAGSDEEQELDCEVQWRPEESEKMMVDLDLDTAGSLSPTGVEDTVSSGVSKTKSRGAPRALNNDNFVRLNMKVKRYRRKGQSMTGSAHKRMAWKQKMINRSKSAGTTCFKCGEEGHWAKQCKGKGNNKKKIDWGGDGEKKKSEVQLQGLPDGQKEEVNESDFPSMKEAVQMARGIKSATTNNTDDDLVDLADLQVIREGFTKPVCPPPTQPLYELSEDGSLPATPPAVYEALNAFGFTSFRPGQEEAIMRILCGQSTLVMLSTGAGKSLCYQLPAYLYATQRRCITLVISPLVSLMEDQVTGLPPSVKGACLHTNMTKAQRDRVLTSIADGLVHFLLLSPEALVGSGRGLNLSKLPCVAFACIDEVHCVSDWSHHFRPSYLRLCKVLREEHGVQCMLGLTATATMVTSASVSQHLGITDYQTATIRGVPIPDNLCLSASRDECKEEALISLLQGERFGSCDSIIVYCTRRQQTDSIATRIRTCLQDTLLNKPQPADEEEGKGKKKKGAKTSGKKPMLAECYHAGLSSAQRKRVQNAFMSGRLRIIVATVAFGMGLDKPDVRGVIHYDLPKSFESYVQEIGRAGRDRKTAHCHVFLDPKDLQELRRHVHSNSIDHIAVKRLILSVFPPCKCRDLHQRSLQAKKECGFEDDGVDYSSIDTEVKSIDTTVNSTPSSDDTSQSSPTTDHSEQDTLRSHTAERICVGHERAVPIESLVSKLDMREEGISTLLCYLELHPERWLENLQPAYATCRLQCYGGPSQLLALAKKCPPVAVAVAQARRQGQTQTQSGCLEFNVIELSDSLGWNSATVKHELRLLQWEFGVNGAQKTGVMVEFTDLAFHFRSPGDLNDLELDKTIQFLVDRLETQERTELYQLQQFYKTMYRMSHKDCWMCCDTVDITRSNKLKQEICQYFERQPALKNGQVTMLSFATEMVSKQPGVMDTEAHCEYEASVRADIRAFIQLYGADHSLSGRAIARVFHGIASPCFPAEVWGKVRRFWRCHLDVDFHLVRRFATQEVMRAR